jgi:glycerol-3-phosphate dehydrogenase
VRPLLDDGASKAQEATRDYVLRCEDGEAPLLTVLGGKITTYRLLAEAALAEIEARLGRRGPAWTARAPLPGGDFEAEAFDALVAALARAHPRLAPADARRLVRLYGTKAAAMLGRDPGRSLGAGLTEAELRHLVDEEWARTAEDVLWRRTKLGLRVSAAEARALAAFMGETGALREVAG